MIYWNSDGSRAAMCGNAALCSARLGARLGLAPAAGMTLMTPAGEVRSRCTGSGNEAEINLPAVAPLRRIEGVCRGGEHQAWLGLVGVPHLIVLVDDVERLDVLERGRELRFDPAMGPEGANVNFISPPATPGKPWLIRTYERGVEGETLACGTGTVAAALLLVQVGRSQLPLTFASRSGSILAVRPPQPRQAASMTSGFREKGAPSSRESSRKSFTVDTDVAMMSALCRCRLTHPPIQLATRSSAMPWPSMALEGI